MDDHFLNKASSFVVESYNHFKPIGSFQNGSSIIQSLNIEGKPGILIEQDPTRLANEFIKAMTKQRFWIEHIHKIGDIYVCYCRERCAYFCARR